MLSLTEASLCCVIKLWGRSRRLNCRCGWDSWFLQNTVNCCGGFGLSSHLFRRAVVIMWNFLKLWQNSSYKGLLESVRKGHIQSKRLMKWHNLNQPTHRLRAEHLNVASAGLLPAGSSSAHDSLPPGWWSAAGTPTSWHDTEEETNIAHTRFMFLRLNNCWRWTHTLCVCVCVFIETDLASLLWISLSFCWIWLFSSITLWASCRTNKTVKHQYDSALFHHIFTDKKTHTHTRVGDVEWIIDVSPVTFWSQYKQKPDYCFQKHLKYWDAEDFSSKLNWVSEWMEILVLLIQNFTVEKSGLSHVCDHRLV